MAKKIQMWHELGPRLATATPVESEEVIEELVANTNQTRGSILGVLSELDAVIEKALKAGRRVKLPNGMILVPVGKKDGSIIIRASFGKPMLGRINVEQRAKWLHAENIGKTEAEMILLWNELHPEDPIED
jgi:hypothetical protein